MIGRRAHWVRAFGLVLGLCLAGAQGSLAQEVEDDLSDTEDVQTRPSDVDMGMQGDYDSRGIIIIDNAPNPGDGDGSGIGGPLPGDPSPSLSGIGSEVMFNGQPEPPEDSLNVDALMLGGTAGPLPQPTLPKASLSRINPAEVMDEQPEEEPMLRPSDVGNFSKVAIPEDQPAPTQSHLIQIAPRMTTPDTTQNQPVRASPKMLTPDTTKALQGATELNSMQRVQ